MKPHSIEFRQKIIEVHENESISIRKIVQRFCVAKSFVKKLLKHYQEIGNIYPQPQGEMTREFIEQAGAKLIYLSPYSPEFSPIENFWSKVKSILRKTAARTYKYLIDGITNAMLQVTQSNIRNWFAHCCYCTS